MSGVKAKGGKKNRKHGRSKRKPSDVAYRAEGRDLKNKKRKIAKAARQRVKDAEKLARRKAAA